jgi:quinolinate synthase
MEVSVMIQDEILRLKKIKNAVILAHYYQDAAIQDVADFVGDSLDLSRKAAETDADIIVFCGVNFMAETAKILAPKKKVLLPVKEAKCPMAMMVNEANLKAYKDANPDRVVICYVNSYAAVKALSDVCVTSSNAERIVLRYKDKKILYIPDKNLGNYLKHKYDLDIDLWPGFCCIHNRLTVDDVLFAKQSHPEALVLIHPEAPLEVLKHADFVGSTRQIIEFAAASNAKEFVIGTERGILHALEKAAPGKLFTLLSNDLACFDMRLTRIEDVLHALETETHEITVPQEIMEKAKIALDRMIEWSKP